MSIKPQSRNNFAATLRIASAAGEVLEYDQLDIRPHITLTDHPDNRVYTVLDGDNWSRIAWKKLGNGRFYWIICDYSEILDPLSELHPQPVTSYLSGLLRDIQPGSYPSTIVVDRKNKYRKGLRIQIQDMASGQILDATVSSLDTGGPPGEIGITPSEATTGWIRADTARVLVTRSRTMKVTIPATARALFECFDFANPLITAED